MGGFTPTTSFTPFSQRGSRLNRERLWRDPLARPSFPESLTTPSPHSSVGHSLTFQSGRQDSNLRPSAPKGTDIVSWRSDQVLKAQLYSGSCLQVLAGEIN
ncbi:MAG: hypothetical protein AB8A40_10400 [Prochlorococcus sp.]